MADIRRDVGDVTPNTFVRQGVVDNSAATILGGLAEGAMKVDTALAKDRLAKASDILNAQYVVGSPAAATQTEVSATDSTPLSPEDDRSLKDFQGVLNTNSRARDQGKMNFDSYQLRGERLLRLAIAKRPGLAQEFRQIAAQHLGTDVLGAEVGYLKSQEEALAAAGSKAAAQADKDKWKLYDDQVAVLKENGFYGYTTFGGPDDPGYQEYYHSVFPALQQKSAAAQQLKMAQDKVALNDTQKRFNEDDNNRLWTAKANDLVASIPGIAQNARTLLTQRGQDKDPVAVRDTANQLLQGIDAQIRDLQVTGANGSTTPAVYDSTMKRLEETRTSLQAVVSGASDQQIIDQWNTLTVAQSKQALYSNDEYVRTRTVLADLPSEVAAQLTAKMDKTITLTVSDMLQDTGSPVEQAKYAGTTVQQMLSAITPDGSSTPPDPIAVDRMGTTFVKSAVAFLTQPDNTFRADQFTRNPASNAAGFVQNLNNHMKTLQKVLPEDKKQELASAIASVTGQQTRLLAGQMYRKAPSLQGKVQANYASPTGQLFELKPGVSLDSLNEVEKANLRAANQAAQLPLILAALGGLTGQPKDGVVQLIGRAHAPGQAAHAAAQKPAATPVQGRGSLAVGTVDSGFRFKGGDPSKQENWEPVQ